MEADDSYYFWLKKMETRLTYSQEEEEERQ